MGNELLNTVIQVLAGAPAGAEGLIYFDSTKHQFGYYSGTEWVYGSVYTLPNAEAAVLGGIELNTDLGGTATAPKVVALHLAGDTAINHKLTEVTDPTNPQDAATLKYVNGKVSGMSWKSPVGLATIAVLPANTAATPTIISTGNELLELDGVAVEVGQRVLIKNQAAAKDNGPYTVVKKGSGAEKWELTRATDANTTALLEDATLFVEAGGTLEGKEFTQTAKVTTVGTTNQVWVEIQSGLAITATAPYLQRVANAISIMPASANHAVIPAEGAISTAIKGTARVANFAVQLKAGVTELELEHLLGTYQVHFQAQENNGGAPGEPIELAWEATTENKVKITWPSAPAAKYVFFASIVG